MLSGHEWPQTMKNIPRTFIQSIQFFRSFAGREVWLIEYRMIRCFEKWGKNNQILWSRQRLFPKRREMAGFYVGERGRNNVARVCDKSLLYQLDVSSARFINLFLKNGKGGWKRVACCFWMAKSGGENEKVRPAESRLPCSRIRGAVQQMFVCCTAHGKMRVSFPFFLSKAKKKRWKVCQGEKASQKKAKSNIIGQNLPIEEKKARFQPFWATFSTSVKEKQVRKREKERM